MLTHKAGAHTDKPHAPKAGPVRKEQMDWGITGDARNARHRIEVRQGETVKFVVRNAGRVTHEFVIGTQAENARHADMMVKFPNMEHDAPYTAHVPPGKTGEIVWTFNRAGEFEFACLIAGHHQNGMVGTITVAAGKA
jgi:uncharacterized cupredoxin-like copper-binding protein